MFGDHKYIRDVFANLMFKRYIYGESDNIPVECEEFLVANKAPVAVAICSYRDFHMTINDCLNDYEFYKYSDCYSTFQSIEQFLSNQLSQSSDPKMPVGSDKVIAASKGYNDKSFRSEGSNKSRKQKKKK